MTLTTPNCPVAETSTPRSRGKGKITQTRSKTAEVEITFDPPWTRDLDE